MDPKIVQEILDDLIPSLEALEAKSTAVLEFLKGQGIASDEKLAPYLEQAASASNVRWLGVRVRIERLLSAAEKESAEKQTKEEPKKPDAAQTKSGEASQPNVQDNAKSAGPESETKTADNDKTVKAARDDAESNTNALDDSSKNEDRAKSHGKHGGGSDASSSKPAESGAEQKVA